MNEELTKVIDVLAKKLGVASQFIVTELSKWKLFFVMNAMLRSKNR